MSEEKDEVIKPEQWTYRKDARKMEARKMEQPANPPPEQKKKKEGKKE